MASIAASPYKQMKLWFRMARYFQSGKILELGTHLGAGTVSWALGSGAEVYTVDYDAQIVAYARKQWQRAGIENIRAYVTDFDRFLDGLQGGDIFDTVFLDGHHTYRDTLRYFNRLLPHLHKGSIFVIHDIYWSEGMKKAWEEIRSDGRVRISVDLFCCGLLFFREENRYKEHFVIRF
jgi:predicted O-methyltransferase YrrM